MDRLEFSAVRQASHALHELLCTFTPFREVTRDVYAAPVPSTKRYSLTVQWPCHKVLAADDVWDYFNVYGHVVASIGLKIVVTEVSRQWFFTSTCEVELQKP